MTDNNDKGTLKIVWAQDATDQPLCIASSPDGITFGDKVVLNGGSTLGPALARFSWPEIPTPTRVGPNSAPGSSSPLANASD